ncbi:MAG: hypothetical protein ACLQPV_09650 [Vulcanimicrobiaceae bacterium]
MAYYELLRVRNCLKNLAIVLAVIFLLAAGLRLLHASGSITVGDDDMNGSGTTHVTRVVLPNGTTQTTVDDPKKHVHVVFVTPKGHSEMAFADASAGVDVALFFGAATMVALIIGSILAAVFSSQNRNHLEIAFMWPVTRERTALAAIAIDVAGIIASLVMGTLAALAVASLFVHVSLLWVPGSAATIVLAIVAPIAWYGLLLAASSSLRSFGAVAGIGWAAGLLLPGFAQIPYKGDGALALVFAVLRVLAHFDPLAYLRFSSETPHGGIAGSPETALAFLVPLAIIYLAAAVLQWRRVEA